MRWFMYRRPLADVFEFGFCANGVDEKQSQRRRPEASGANGTNERTMSRCVPRKWRELRYCAGTGDIFTNRLLAAPVLLKARSK